MELQFLTSFSDIRCSNTTKYACICAKTAAKRKKDKKSSFQRFQILFKTMVCLNYYQISLLMENMRNFAVNNFFTPKSCSFSKSFNWLVY